MDKTLKILGTLILIGVLILAAVYLLDLSGITGSLDPGTSIGSIFKGITDSVDGIGASIARMFSNFGK